MAFSSISDLWNKWNIRGIVILSLSLQVFLILCAPLRKKMVNSHIIFLLWLAYLMADWVAAFGVGLISHSQGNLSAHPAEVDEALRAFWASFLLLHLGGPDTITAFSLEDSSLWRRHLLSLIFQIGVAIYVFVQIFSNDQSLLIPTMLVFLAGVIKNAERTLALYLSSLPRLRESMLMPFKSRQHAYKELAQELQALGCEYPNEKKAKLAESIVVKHAYFFFDIFKVFLSELFYSSEERLLSHKYFYEVFAVDALRVISVELHFMYEMLHTKVLAIRSNWSYIFRSLAFTEVAMAFVLFYCFKKHELHKLDVVITYILLFGGIALDIITLLILIFSDWTVAEIMHYKTRSSKLDSFLHGLVSAMNDIRKPRFATYKAEPNLNAAYVVLNTPFPFRRWSESICACNLFSAFLKEIRRNRHKRARIWGIIAFSKICSFPISTAKKIISSFHQIPSKIIERDLSIISATSRCMSKNPFINELWIFIFEEVKRKSRDAYNSTEARKIFEARGDRFLQGGLARLDCGNLLEHITKGTYDHNVMIWHVATEIWYNIEKPIKRNDKREFSKILSDYQLYLLVNQPNVVSNVAGFAKVTIMGLIDGLHVWKNYAKDVEGLCYSLYNDAYISPPEGGILLRGIDLAKKMESFRERKWEVMSGVWVEMLSFAAGHIKGEAHVQVLSKGGELLAFVWLLMAHFGCLYKPEWDAYEDAVFEMELERAHFDDNGDQEEDVSIEVRELGDDNGDQEEDVSVVETELV